ncbi:hypothetical protein E6Q11_06520, partial [Candidatus Dojkabacteria bacterium]
MFHYSESTYITAEEKTSLSLPIFIKHLLRPTLILLFILVMVGSSLNIQLNQTETPTEASASPATAKFSNFNKIIAKAAECEEGDDTCSKKKLEEALESSKLDSNSDGFGEALDGAKAVDNCSTSTQGIKEAVSRVFSVDYMNCTPSATIDNNTGTYKTLLQGNNWRNCGIPSGPKFPGQEDNTIFWHNCDVPNLLTEMLQDINYAFFPQGVTGASVQPVKTNNGWFGYSSQTPGFGDNQGSVLQDGSANITALEAFGYNLRYSEYKGEWDYIKVMTSARALSNFGAMDSMKLGVQTFFKSVSGGVKGAVNGFMDNLKAKDITSLLTAPSRILKGWTSGGTSSAINSILDTSDANVFATMSWYRPNFGGTLYNARQLTQDEISRHITNQINKFLGTLNIPVAEPPEDLAAASYSKLASITRPRPGKCIGEWTVSEKQIVNMPGEEKTKDRSGNVSEIPFAGTKEDCEKFIENASKPTGLPDNWAITSTKVTISTFENQFTLAQWETEAGWEAVARKYQIYCTIERTVDAEGD